ncbi:DinB family protein [Rhodanobacter lindaniclasticus]
MSLKRDFELGARYNQWMNTRLYAAAAQLDEAQWHADRGAFFGSIAATLKHVLAADTHWMKRFAAAWPSLTSLDTVRALPLPALVRGITFPELARLRQDREVVDAALIAFTGEATDALYEQPLRYVNSAGESRREAVRAGAATRLRSPDPPPRPSHDPFQPVRHRRRRDRLFRADSRAVRPARARRPLCWRFRS